jgi:predicted DsbA family dithiol-disulfide isomerase
MDALTQDTADVAATELVHAGTIGVISDVICPWCYIGKRHLRAALDLLRAEGLAFDVTWHAYQLNPDMPAGGADRAAYRAAKFGSKARADQLEARVIEAAGAAGLPFRADLIARTPNTIAAHRLVWLAGRRGVQDAIVDGLFDAYFVEGRDIGDPAILARRAADAGLDEAATRAFLDGDEGEAEVRAEDAAARRGGISGVPSFRLDGHVLFSGAMPAATMADAFRHAHRVLRQNRR